MSASITVEAAFVFPLFILLVFALLIPQKALDTQRKLQTVVEMICEDLSLYAYMAEDGNGEGEEESEREGESKSEGKSEREEAQLFSNVAAGVWLQRKVSEYGDAVVVRNVQVPDANGDIVLNVIYQENIPVLSVISGGISMEVSAKRRGWTGVRGKLTVGDACGDSADADVEMVYIGKNMGRYHRDRNCHYISNDYQAVSVEEAKRMSDSDGHRFTACSSCREEIGENGTVYVTPGGQHYHGSTECRAMVSYVRKVPLTEVEYLGACSYCGG